MILFLLLLISPSGIHCNITVVVIKLFGIIRTCAQWGSVSIYGVCQWTEDFGSAAGNLKPRLCKAYVGCSRPRRCTKVGTCEHCIYTERILSGRLFYSANLPKLIISNCTKTKSHIRILGKNHGQDVLLKIFLNPQSNRSIIVAVNIITSHHIFSNASSYKHSTVLAWTSMDCCGKLFAFIYQLVSN